MSLLVSQSPEPTDKNGGFDITEEDAAMLVKAFDRSDASIDAYKEHFGMNDITEKSGIDILKLLKKLDPDTFDKALRRQWMRPRTSVRTSLRMR